MEPDRADRAEEAAAEYLDVLQDIEAAQETEVVEQALTAARERLGMDAAYLTTVGPERQRLDALVGDAGVIGAQAGASIPVEKTYCARMLRGEIPRLIPDTHAEPGVSDLGATRLIGAYIGVPVKLPDGRVHGTLCCASRTSRTDLGPGEVAFMDVLAGMIATRLQEAEGNIERLTARLRGDARG